MRGLTLLLLCVLSFPAGAEEFATKADASALVGKVNAALKADKQKALDEITAKDPKWIDRDLYPTVMSLDGKVLAHGQNAKMVGKDLLEFKDPDGKAFYKERMDLAKSKGKFWQDYKFTDPVTKKVLPKEAYCEKLGDMVVCAGVYKR